MANPVASSFSKYTFSEEETLQFSILSHPQTQLIQTERAEVAEQILGLIYDPAKPHEFIQQEAFLKGQLQVFTYLLSRSAEAEKALRDLATRS